MRKSGMAKADKKASRVAAEGQIIIEIDAQKKHGVMVEVNCETDFVANGDDFKALRNKWARSPRIQNRPTSTRLVSCR